MKKIILLNASIVAGFAFGQATTDIENTIRKTATQISEQTQQLIEFKKTMNQTQAIALINQKINNLKKAMFDEIKKIPTTQGKKDPKAINKIHQKYLPQINNLLKQREAEFMKNPQIQNLSNTITTHKKNIESKKNELEQLKHKSLLK